MLTILNVFWALFTKTFFKTQHFYHHQSIFGRFRHRQVSFSIYQNNHFVFSANNYAWAPLRTGYLRPVAFYIVSATSWHNFNLQLYNVQQLLISFSSICILDCVLMFSLSVFSICKRSALYSSTFYHPFINYSAWFLFRLSLFLSLIDFYIFSYGNSTTDP